MLGYEACFLAGLAKLDPRSALSRQQSALSDAAAHIADTRRAGRPPDSRRDAGATLPPHRPFKIIYATLYYDVRPTFVVDITSQFEQKFASILAYTSQFSDQEAGKDLFPAHDEIHARVESMARFYGMLCGVTYAEPFLQKEVGLVEDLLALPVKSI
jgi:LmbE family N-acetylglucosaminyl deacetylase